MRKGYTRHDSLQISDAALRRVKEQAAYWFIRGADEQLDVEGRREYLRWLRNSPTNIAEMLQTAAYVGKLRKLLLMAAIRDDAAAKSPLRRR